MNVAAVWTAKLTGAALRRVGRHGNALPGLVVERLFPRFLPRALARLEHGTIVVSGTNGKTTTTKMVATVLSGEYRVLTNDTGSNFVRGAITAVCDYADWRGRIEADVAVFELDEAHAVRFVEVVRPKRVLLLNVMRDQLDRFGEIDTTAGLLSTVARAASTAVVLNRDDPRVAAIAADVNTAEVSYYGVSPALRADFPTDDELYGAADAEPPVVAPANAELLAMDLGETSRLTLRIGGETHEIALRAGGAHNAQNAAGAAAMSLTFGLSPAQIAAGLRAVEPAFGRGQTFSVQGRRLVLHLVKNPAGFRQTLRTLTAYDAESVMIAINDDYADGRDVSWLWDVDFAGPLAAARSGRPWVLTSGTRATDMALRLRYDEIPAAAVEPDLREGVLRAVRQVEAGETVIVLSTYTAMWALHDILADVGQAVATADAEMQPPGRVLNVAVGEE
ncbi:MAG: MurT ligase domain-containing protein [Actinomycetota bacterium]|nr:MurT ligase domain-containing protein [Actinomycetota bacterium]